MPARLRRGVAAFSGLGPVGGSADRSAGAKGCARPRGGGPGEGRPSRVLRRRVNQRRNRARILAGRIYTTIAAVDPFALVVRDTAGDRTALGALLDEIEGAMERIADAVGDAYLQHLPRLRA